MKEYILDYIITPDLTTQASQGLTTEIEKQILGLGKVIKSYPLKRTKLGYPIKDKTEGFWGRIEFLSKPEGVTSIIQYLRKKVEVLRYLLVKKPKKKKQKTRKHLSVSKAQPKQEKETQSEEQEEKVDLKKIEEQLDSLKD